MNGRWSQADTQDRKKKKLKQQKQRSEKRRRRTDKKLDRKQLTTSVNEDKNKK